MSSASFRFRRFEVFHDRCAMKVGTDGVLLGAWAGQSLSEQPLSEQLLSDASAPAQQSDAVAGSFPVLDIGTGSGLVALMLAQRFPGAHITALDIEPSAVEQAQYNFAHSPWPDRLTAVHSSLQSFPSSVRFRLIVSNPPYFRNSLKNPDKSRELARHTDSLSYSDLVAHTARLLAADGVACYILPAEAESELLSLLRAYSLCPLRILQVHSKPGKPAKRLLIEFTHLSSSLPATSLDGSSSLERDAFSVESFYEKENNRILSEIDTKNSLNSRTTPEPTPSKSRTTPEPTRSIFYIESLSSPRSDEYASLTHDFYL